MPKGMLTVRDLIKRRDHDTLYSIQPNDSVQAAAKTMRSRSISSVAVVREEADGVELVGILSEKDVARVVAEDGNPAETAIQSVMTTDVVTVDAETTLIKTAQFMLDNKVRHLPVMEDGKPLTLISMRDVLGLLVDSLVSENEMLRAELEWMGFAES